LKTFFRSVLQPGSSCDVEFLPRLDALFVTRSMRRANSVRSPDDPRRRQTGLRATFSPNRKLLLDSGQETTPHLRFPQYSEAFDRRPAPHSSPRFELKAAQFLWSRSSRDRGSTAPGGADFRLERWSWSASTGVRLSRTQFFEGRHQGTS